MATSADLTSPLTLAMVAGETSGDLLAGLLMGGMKQRWPAMQAAGIGGPRMAAHGFEACESRRDLGGHERVSLGRLP